MLADPVPNLTAGKQPVDFVVSAHFSARWGEGWLRNLPVALLVLHQTINQYFFDRGRLLLTCLVLFSAKWEVARRGLLGLSRSRVC